MMGLLVCLLLAALWHQKQEQDSLRADVDQMKRQAEWDARPYRSFAPNVSITSSSADHVRFPKDLQTVKGTATTQSQ
jgi:FtsZ-interacting cell division protein ZipA